MNRRATEAAARLSLSPFQGKSSERRRFSCGLARPSRKSRGKRLQDRFGPRRNRRKNRRQTVSAANLLLHLLLIIQKRFKRLIEIFIDEVFDQLVVHADDSQQQWHG